MRTSDSERSERPDSAGVIEVRGLRRDFGAKRALDGIDLTVPRGVVFGLVGANGAGKTTLIRHLLGLLRPQAGSVSLFGRDPTLDPVGVLSQVGYLSEEGDLPGWMRVSELMRYLRAFYPSWDDAYAEELRRRFALDPAARIGALSKGQRARAGLIAALAHRPSLLLLDEPSSGLDPVVRRDILGAIVRTIAEEGRTVFFSSHLLDEVERISDRVAMLQAGRVAFCGDLDEIKASHHWLTFRFPDARPTPPAIGGVLASRRSGNEWEVATAGEIESLARAGRELGGELLEQRAMSLSEIFLARMETSSGEPEKS